MSDHLEACRTGSRFGFNDFNGLDRERFGFRLAPSRICQVERLSVHSQAKFSAIARQRDERPRNTL